MNRLKPILLDWAATLAAVAVLYGLFQAAAAVFLGVALEPRAIPADLALHLALGDPGIVLKRELLNIPFYGWYLGKAAAIPIERAAGARALRLMTDTARKVLDQGRPVLIFPEGTRKKPGAAPDYKPGVAGLYAMLDVPCVPVALDSGVYWRGFWKRPGTITLAFLEPIPPGLKRGAFMPLLEQRIEQATQALVASAS